MSVSLAKRPASVIPSSLEDMGVGGDPWNNNEVTFTVRTPVWHGLGSVNPAPATTHTDVALFEFGIDSAALTEEELIVATLFVEHADDSPSGMTGRLSLAQRTIAKRLGFLC